MYNHYQGNSGRFTRVPDPTPPTPRPLSAPASPVRPMKKPPPGMGGGLAGILPLGEIQEKLGALIPRLTEELETEDLLLALVLYLMYRESGDKELLIILGAMFLL